MKKMHKTLSLLMNLGLITTGAAYGAEAPLPGPASHFTPAQLVEMKHVIEDHLRKHPQVVTKALEAEMEKQQQAETAVMEKAVAQHRDEIFKTPHPMMGNPKGSHSLVVFLDPLCGFCHKIQEEFDPLLKKDKDLKILFIDIPIMGKDAVLPVKAMLAAHLQGKYHEMRKFIASAEKVTRRKLMKEAKAIGMDVKKLDADIKGKQVQDQLDKNLALSKAIGVSGTPTLIINERKVQPGYAAAQDLAEKLNSSKAPKKK